MNEVFNWLWEGVYNLVWVDNLDNLPKTLCLSDVKLLTPTIEVISMSCSKIASRSIHNLNEETTSRYEIILLDENKLPIPNLLFSSIQMTLIESSSGGIVNNRFNQNVLNDNNCNYDGLTGLFTWDIQTKDTEIVNPRTPIDGYENHEALICFKWGSSNQFNHVVRLRIKNLRLA